MGTPGIPARLRKIASVAGSGSSQHERPQPVLVGQASPSPAAGSHCRPTDAALSPVSYYGAAGDLADEADADETDADETDAREVRQRSSARDSDPASVKVPRSDPDQTLPPKRGTSRGTRPRRGRPRSERADRDILLATLDVLAEKGMGGLSIEEVAARAGVGKTTIYRRWSSRGTLALDAFLAEFEGQQALPDTGSFAGDLKAALSSWVSAVSGTSAGKLLVGLIAEIQQDRSLAAAWQDQVIAPLRAQYSIMLDRAINRGEIPALTDAGVVLDLVFGACYYRLLHGHRPLNEQFVNQVVGVVAAGVGATMDLSREPSGSARASRDAIIATTIAHGNSRAPRQDRQELIRCMVAAPCTPRVAPIRWE